MTNQIRSRVERCYICHQYQEASTREPLQPHHVPNRPWEKGGVDIFRDYDYLITVDYLSNFF